MPVGFGRVGVQGARVGQVVPPMQFRRGLRSQIGTNPRGNYVGDICPEDACRFRLDPFYKIDSTVIPIKWYRNVR